MVSGSNLGPVIGVAMIVNHSVIEYKDKYGCKEAVMRYLVYKCGLSVLSYDKNKYYFTDNETLRMHLKNMPLLLRFNLERDNHLGRR